MSYHTVTAARAGAADTMEAGHGSAPSAPRFGGVLRLVLGATCVVALGAIARVKLSGYPVGPWLQRGVIHDIFTAYDDYYHARALRRLRLLALARPRHWGQHWGEARHLSGPASRTTAHAATVAGGPANARSPRQNLMTLPRRAAPALHPRPAQSNTHSTCLEPPPFRDEELQL